jgi:hypothetical protein
LPTAVSRFVGFVTANVSGEFFRADARGAEQPLRRPELERVVKHAYRIRSRNVHELVELPPEQWAFGRAETVTPPGVDTMLTHEGLARLARHVVRNYVERPPVGIDADFVWRGHLPGKLLMRLAPQYWLWQAAGFDRDTVGRYFSGFVGHLSELIAKRQEGVPPLEGVLERIERLVRGIADGPAKTMMVAIYALWHRFVVENEHRPDADRFLSEHAHLLQRVEPACFAVGLLSGELPPWSDQEWRTLATERRAERAKRRHLELPPGFDAALQVVVADRLADATNMEEACAFAGFAVDEMPGNGTLIAWETAPTSTGSAEIDLLALAVQGDPVSKVGAAPEDVEEASDALGPGTPD